jgi:hypothetical protein
VTEADQNEEKEERDQEEMRSKLPTNRDDSWRTYRPDEFRDWKTVPTCRSVHCQYRNRSIS